MENIETENWREIAFKILYLFTAGAACSSWRWAQAVAVVSSALHVGQQLAGGQAAAAAGRILAVAVLLILPLK